MKVYERWTCSCGATFDDTHAAITRTIPQHTRGTDHVVRVAVSERTAGLAGRKD